MPERLSFSPFGNVCVLVGWERWPFYGVCRLLCGRRLPCIRGMSPAGDADEEGGIEDGSGGDDRFVEGRRGAVAFGEFLPDGRCGEVEISQSLQVAQSDAQRPVVYFLDEFGTV